MDSHFLFNVSRIGKVHLSTCTYTAGKQQFVSCTEDAGGVGTLLGTSWSWAAVHGGVSLAGEVDTGQANATNTLDANLFHRSVLLITGTNSRTVTTVLC